MFVSLFEFCIFIIIMAFIYIQIIKPYFKGTKMFPVVFKERKLKSEIRGLNQKVEEKELENTIKTIKKEKGVK